MIIACPECTRPFELRDDHIAALIQIECPSCHFRMILDFAAANDPALVESGMRMASGFRTAAEFRAWSGGGAAVAAAAGGSARTSPVTPPAAVRTIAPRPGVPASDEATTLSVPRVIEPVIGEPELYDEPDDPSIQVRPRSAGTAVPPVRERTITPREVAYTPRDPRGEVSETMTTRPAPGRTPSPAADDVYDEDDGPPLPSASSSNRTPLHVSLDASMEEDDAPTQIHAPGARPYEVGRGSDVIVRRPLPETRPQPPADGYEYGEPGTGAPQSLYTTEPAPRYEPASAGAPPMADLAPEPARRTVTMTPVVERMPPHTPPGPVPRVDAGAPAGASGPAPAGAPMAPMPEAERAPRSRAPRFETFDAPAEAPKRSIGGTIVVLLLLLLSLGLVGASLALENTPDPRPLLEKAYRKYIKGE
jgi:hypothetical protein